MKRWLMLMVCATVSLTAHAGRQCEAKLPSVAAIRQGLQLAQQTVQSLDAQQARVAIVARAGRNLDRYGVRWSHLGFAMKENGKWRVIHKLNHCATASASLYRQGLGDFMLDDLHRYEAAVVIPTPEVQTAIMQTLAHPLRRRSMHTQHYNLVSYPWSIRAQQSNQWVLETVAAALDASIINRQDAQAWLRARDYQGGIVRIPTVERLGARMTQANVSFEDQPMAQRMAGRIETVTADSVLRWLQREGLTAPMQLVQ